MKRIIKLETLYMKKLLNSILNQILKNIIEQKNNNYTRWFKTKNSNKSNKDQDCNILCGKTYLPLTNLIMTNTSPKKKT